MAAIKNALVVGAGIGGLAAAAALPQHGIDVDIIELRPGADVLGVGINQPGNALRALRALGVLEEILAVGFEFNQYKFFDYQENLITEVRSVIGGEDVPPNVALTRRDLHRVLIGAGERQGVKVRYGTTISELVDHGDWVEVTFSDGSTGTYDLVVGFDGINSSLRRRLFGAEHDPVETGFGVWRTELPRPEHVRYAAMFHGINVKAGYVPLNEQEMYLLVVTPESRAVRYDKADLVNQLKAKLAPFVGPIGEIRNNLRPDDNVAFGLLTEVPLPLPWHEGRVIVLGDAAHACVPHLAQGAGMAIEDAVLLAEELDQARDLEASLHTLEARRFPRTKFVQDVSRAVLFGEMHPVDEESLAATVVELRAELTGRMNGSDTFLNQPA